MAAEHSATDADLAAYKELNQARTDALKESLQKDVQAQTVRLERQDKLIDSFSTRISDLSFFLTVFGLVAGLLGYFTVSSRAKNEARSVAEDWVKKEGQKAIDAKLNDFNAHLAAEKAAATDQRQKLFIDAAAPLAELQRQINTSLKSIDGLVQEPTTPISTQSDPIGLLVEALKHKPEAEYGFDDWNVRAHDSYNKGNRALAAEFWLQAARGGKGNGAQVAQSLLNAAIALSQLKRHQEAIDVYSKVSALYGDAPELVLRNLVAQSLVNKAHVLAELSRVDEAIDIFTEVASRFGNDSEVSLRKQAIYALTGKARLLGKLNHYEKVIELNDEVILKYGDVPDVDIRPLIADARNSKGYGYMCIAKAKWNEEASRLNNLQSAAELFKQAEPEVANKWVVYGNQAYTAYLLNQQADVRPLLKQAFELGGEQMYTLTLADLNVNPVPVDDGFRALLDEIWAEVKPKT